MTATTNHGLLPVRQPLGNGVVVTAQEARATPAVAILASFHAGAIFDPPGEAGVAHFVSRTIDRGTRTRSADDIALDLDNRGVSLNVAINRHVINIVLNCLTEDFDDMLGLVGAIAMDPAFPSDQVANRRSEIITTIRQDEDNPATMAGDGLMGLLYPNHPYSRPLRGTVDGIERMAPASLSSFHQARCAPNTLSLVVVGDVDTGHVIDTAHRVFGDWRAPAAAPVALPEVRPSVTRQRLVIPMMSKAQADIAYGFVTILRSDPAYYACWLMNNVLGQYSLGGRLGDNIRERQGMAYYVFSVLDANVVPGPLAVRAGVNPSNVDRAVASIDEELARMAAAGPTEREVMESKQYLIGSMPRTLETNIGIATFLQTAEFFNLGLDYDRRLPGLLERVTRDEVHDVARRMLDPSRAAVVIAGPYEDKATS